MDKIAILIGSLATPFSSFKPYSTKDCTDIDYIVNDQLYFYLLLKHGDKISNKWESDDACHLTLVRPGGPIGSLTQYDDIIIEIECPKPGSSGEYLLNNTSSFCDHVSHHYRISKFVDVNAVTLRATVETLTQIKKSHLINPSAKWRKHMDDYIKLNAFASEVKCAKEDLNTLFKLRRQETINRSKKNPNLNVTKDEFFDTKGVIQVFDHDSIHEAVAIEDSPAYTNMLDGEVKCSRDKWDNMTVIQKDNCVLEESAVLALERAIIPSMYLGKEPAPIQESFMYAMYKVCTTITSGWFRDYAIDRYFTLNNCNYSYQFVDKFISGMKSGIVKKL